MGFGGFQLASVSFSRFWWVSWVSIGFGGFR